MINSVYQYGVRVETISPDQGSLNVNLYTDIKLSFNAELIASSIINSFAVFEDTFKSFINMDSIKNNTTAFRKINGNVTYKDRVITFTPNAPLNKSMKYIICIKENGIKDIQGNTVLAEQIFYFSTQGDNIDAKVNIVSPTFGNVVSDVPEIRWNDVGSDAYFIEISTQPTFETLTYSATCVKDSINKTTPTSHIPETMFMDGLYYLRIRALNGPWSEVFQFFVKRIQQAVTSDSDLAEIIDQLNFDERPIELLEVFPYNEESNVTLNLGIIYFKFSGKVDITDLNLRDTVVEMLPTSEEEALPTEVQGEWISVYDSESDASYLIFKIHE